MGHRRGAYARFILIVLFTGAGVWQVDHGHFSASASASASNSVPEFSAFVDPGTPALLQSISASWGYAPPIASDYFQDGSWPAIDNDLGRIATWRNSGYKMTWAVPMLPQVAGVTLANGAAGQYNEHFALLATNLISAGMGNSILRLGWEFNKGEFPWYAAGQPGNFVNYWHQIVDTMRSIPGANFQFEWNPNRGDLGIADAAMGNLTDYYPGNEYVSMVGMDIYDVNWDYYPGANAEFSNIRTQPWGLDWIAAFGQTHDKPLSIPEFGLGWGPSAPGSGPISGSGPLSGGDNPTFINDMFSWIAAHDVANGIFWDYGSSSIENGQNPLTAMALAHGLSAPHQDHYWEVASDGGVFAFNAPFSGSMGGTHLNAPIVGIT